MSIPGQDKRDHDFHKIVRAAKKGLELPGGPPLKPKGVVKVSRKETMIIIDGIHTRDVI